jgi:putative nucleotidyltransferase with HDIG domain
MVVVRRWIYRSRQFRQALRERRSPIADEFVSEHLDGAGRALFCTMSRRDQAHSIATAARLSVEAPGDPELLQAALLHDVGKGQQTTMDRVAYVLLAAIDQGALKRLARDGGGVRGALHRSLHHPALGAAMAAQIGCSQRVCQLIARHHRAPADDASLALQWADEVA